MLKRFVVALSLLVLLQSVALAGLEGTKAAYMGGTSSDFKEMKRAIEGVFDTTSDGELRFVYSIDKTERSFSIPYSTMVDLKYGSKPGMMSLFSRKRMHYLTIEYKDSAGKDQVAVFELGKRIVRPTLAVVELRSGKKVQVTD